MDKAITLTGSIPVTDAQLEHVARSLSMLDPRCSWPCHNWISVGESCPQCHLDLQAYLEWVREGLKAWPL
jgi:hypothetical protein